MINDMCLKLLSKQAQKDSGDYIKKGPGRKRQNPELSSEELKNIAKQYLKDNFEIIVSSKKSQNRKDAAITGYIRVIKKLTYFLVEKTAPRNMYKRKLPEEYVVAFTESFISFLSIMDTSDNSLVESFIEYITIYFPKIKVQQLIDLLGQERNDLTFLKAQQNNLKMRESTTKSNIKRWVKTSSIFKQLLELAKEVLIELRPSMRRNEVLRHLIRVTKDFTS